MTEELQLFCEDMDEQLSIMEDTLLDISEISIDEIDSEMINKLFRAMHTMKGNSSMFSFDHIVAFAHVAENLLDEIRNGKIKITEEMIELFLLINDHSKTLIDLAVANEPLDTDAQEYHDELLEQLNIFLGEEESNNSVSNDMHSDQKNEDQSAETNYKIEIELKENFFTSGMELTSILRYLDVIGDIGSVKIDTSNIPDISELSPLNAYLKLIVVYTTSECEQELVDAFEFVQEDIELAITNLDKKEKEKEDSPQELRIEESSISKKVETQNKIVPPSKKDDSNKTFPIKVDSSKIDTLIKQISEVVITNAKIIEYTQNIKDNDFEEVVLELSTMLEEVREGIMNIRMMQVGDSFNKFRRIVSDTAKKMGKDINFQILGAETELDKTVIEKISDPIVHMLRNSVDHAIETPEIRIENGKSPQGNILLKAYPDAGTIVIEISDDGAGIDKELIFNKALEKGLVKSDEVLSDSQIYKLIFAPGFSTAKEISDISGRGVGMDVVRKNIEELRGTVEIESTLGVGTTLTIRLPLTLAIIDGFLVQSGSLKYIIPLDMILKCIEFDHKTKQKLKEKGYITLRSNILPVLNVAHYFDDEVEKSDMRQNIVVVKYGNTQMGLLVDELYGEFQTVIKPLGELFENVAGISGSTILGSGEIALILDIQKLIEKKIMEQRD